METVANNPEDGQTEILFFSCTSGEVQRKLYMQLFDAFHYQKLLSANCKKSASKVQAFTLILYAVLILYA